MSKNQSKSTQHAQHPTQSSLSLFTAFCTGAAVALTGILTSKFLGRKAEEPQPEIPSQEIDPGEIHKSLVRAISHDLRAPLSGIMGNSLLYLENHKTLDEDEKLQLVSHIHQDSGWLINVVENFLALARIQDAGNMVSTREEIVEEVLGEAMQKMEMRHPDFAVHAVIPEEIIILPMDALLIEQVLINLLENALLHSGSKKPVDVIVEDGTDFVTFTVKDYGQGIPPKMAEHLFDSASLTEAVPDSHKKAGIGLLICKTIISAHHGSLTGKNHGHGAEFIFTLPKRSC